MKQNNKEKTPFASDIPEQPDCPLDSCFRHSLCHGNRLSFSGIERGGGFDEVKAGGGVFLCNGDTDGN